MNAHSPRKNTGARAAAIAFIAVSLIGSAFISLRADSQAALAREAARRAIDESVHRLEQRLATAIEAAQALAIELQGPGGRGASKASVHAASAQLIKGRFWVSANRIMALHAGTNQLATDELARDITWLDSIGNARNRSPSILGPMRSGSSWIVLARAPVMLVPSTGEESSRGWAVVSMELSELLQLSGLGQLSGAGFDYQLLYRESDEVRPRIISGSMPGEIADPVQLAVPLTGSAWTLRVAPKGGWHSWTDLTVHGALVALGALLAAVLAYDAARKPLRLRLTLAKYQRRLRNASRRLTEEIQQREDVERQYSHADHHDAFTGLPNRRQFMNRLDQSLRRARRQPGNRVAVIILDFDRFRTINDSLGQAAGDELLVEAARRFETRLPPLELTLARLGDVQFGILLLDIHSHETALNVAKKLQDALLEPFNLRQQIVMASASLGVSCSSPGPQRAEDLLREADLALSKARSQGSAQCVMFDPATRTEITSVMQLETDLHMALERREFRLLFQPIVSLDTARDVGMEALLRWHHAQEGVLTPEQFIAVAEQSGLIVPITRWIVREVCRQARAWREGLPDDAEFYVGVNLTSRDLREADFCQYVASVINETQLPPGTLRFEVTEGSLISNVGAARGLLAGLRQLGIPLMLDDFGTGYSSLSYLQLFDFDCLKIDRSFVSRITADGRNCGIVRAIVHMAKDLGLKTIAEGIESVEIANVLHELHCDYAQGYFFSKPIEAESIEQRLRVQWTTVPIATQRAERG